MGHKVHPYGFRIGVIKPWLAKWYADRDYATLLQEDMRIRALVSKQLANASVSQVEIERGINHVTVTVHTAKPGIVIGRKGAQVKVLRQKLEALSGTKVKVEVEEITQPDLEAQLVAENIADQIERRISHSRAMKRAIGQAMRQGAKGIVYGRNVIQHPDPRGMTRALMAIVHDGAAPDAALAMIGAQHA